MFLNINKLLLTFILIGLVSLSHAGSVIIVNEDSAGEGLNDQTTVSPIDGNKATTLGQQRLAVLQLAADVIENIFDLNVDVKIGVTFDPDEPGILGSAGPEDFEYSSSTSFLPFASTWYVQALGNQFYGYDRKISSNDISVNINSSRTDYYLGFDSSPSYSFQYSLFAVVLHEIIHGLGFLEDSNSSTGDFYSYPDIFHRYLQEQSLSLTWPSMSSSQRYNSLRGESLYWIGSNVRAESQSLQNSLYSWQYSGHTASGHVEIYAPSPFNPGSSGSHFDENIIPHELMEHVKSFDDPNHHIGMAKQVLQDIGWSVFNNGDKPLITAISSGSTLNNETYQTSFVIFDNDNAYHRKEAYNWSSNAGVAHYVMGFSVSSSNQNIVASSGISISGVSGNLSNSGDALRQVSIAPVAGSAGTTTITITATDSNGNADSQSFVLTVIQANTPPTIAINSPSNGVTFFTLIQSFTATASDLEDGELNNISWSYKENNQSNYISAGSGSAVSMSLADNDYVIRACVSDSQGVSECSAINITVSVFGDEDNDGVNNFTEIANGTDPYDNDTDDDGLFDGNDDDPLTPCECNFTPNNRAELKTAVDMCLLEDPAGDCVNLASSAGPSGGVYGSIGGWAVSNVSNMSSLFRYARAFNQPLGNWDTSNVTDMSNMFYGADAFNQPLDNWDTSNVTNMSSMFWEAGSFNSSISGWDVSSLTSKAYMFANNVFNQPLEGWDTSSWTSTARMFQYADAFNQPLGNWDTSNVTDMSNMFYGADAFNQPLDNWDTSNVTNMSSMFWEAGSFNSSISGWDVSSLTSKAYMFANNVFNQPLEGWDTSSWTSTARMFQYADAFNQPLGNWDTSNVTDMSNMFYGADAFNQPLDNWDTSNVTNMSSMFWEAGSFNSSISGWDVSSLTSKAYMFANNVFNQPLEGWDTSSWTSTARMFQYADAFNQPLGNWDTSNVTDMSNMFYGADAFNQPLDNWDTSNVTNMSSMFWEAGSFNSSISGWDVSSLTSKAYMFANNVFNQPLEGWDTSSWTSTARIFQYADAFNQPLGNWDTSNVTDMSNMFYGADAFNQPLDDWDTSNVTTMSRMFYDAGNLSQDFCWLIDESVNTTNMFLGSNGAIGCDTDEDGIDNFIDNCPDVPNVNQDNLDGDSLGDACDLDIDGDGLDNLTEVSLRTNPYDNDSDGDGLVDGNDPEPLVPQSEEIDIPAMGGIGLLALGLSMLGLGAVRLKKK